MNDKNENKLKAESEDRFMDALMQEHFSENKFSDAQKMQNIINKAHELKKANKPCGSSRIYFSKFLSAAALFAVVAGLIFYMNFYQKNNIAEDQNATTPILLVADGSKVIDGKNNNQYITKAKRLNSEEKIKVEDSGSAFVIFQDLTKIEVAAQSQLYFKELENTALPAWKRSSATDKKIFFNKGIFRIDSSTSTTAMESDYGRFSGNSKIILMITPEICYVEVCRGTLYFTGSGADTASLKITQGNCLIVKNGMQPVILKKTDPVKLNSDKNEIAKYKSLLIDDKSYDNILTSLINKNAVDICLNKKFIRNIIRDI